MKTTPEDLEARQRQFSQQTEGLAFQLEAMQRSAPYVMVEQEDGTCAMVRQYSPTQQVERNRIEAEINNIRRRIFGP